MTQPLSPNLLPIVTAPGLASSGESGTGDPTAFTRELRRELQREALTATRRTNGPSESLRKPTAESRTDPSAPPRKIERDRDSPERSSSDRSPASPRRESKTTAQGTNASSSETSQEPAPQADANSNEQETATTQEAGDASKPVSVAEDAPLHSAELPETGEEVTEENDVEQTISGEVESAPQPLVVVAVADESAPIPQDTEAAAKEPTAAQAGSTLDVAADAEAHGDGEQQGGKSDQEPPQKTAPNKATDVSDSSATKEPTSDRQAGAPGALTGAAENPASASSTIPQVESFGLISSVDDVRTPTETVETPQSTDAPKEARPVTAPLSHRLNSTLLLGQQPASAETEPRGHVDPSRFVNRVSRAFQAAEQRGGVVQLRLSPPELGAMRIELSVQQGVLSARLETETPAAKSVLLDNLPALRERLAAMDIRVDKFDVDVQQEGSSKQDNWQSEQQGGDRRRSRSPETASSTPRGTEAGMLSADDIPRPNLPLNGRLNVIA